MFDIDEILGKEVCLELIGVDENGEPEIVSGILEPTSGNFICLRGNTGKPYLFNERYIKAIYLRPEKVEEQNDN